MSKSVGQFAHLRLFVEGVEIPVTGANVNAGVNMPATANIDILPDDSAFEFHPRTVVHLFYYDWEESVYGGTGRQATVGELGTVSTAFSPVEKMEQGGATIPPNTRGFRPADMDRAYKLLFCGEVFTVTYAKQGPGSRQITLQCYDFSNLWDTYYVYTTTWSQSPSQPGEIVGRPAGFYGAMTGGFDDIVSSAEEVIRRSLQAKPNHPLFRNEEETSEILGGLISVIESFFGVHGKAIGQDDWITISERRVRLLDQIGADSGKTAAAIFKRSAFDDWLLNSVGRLGPLASVRDIIQLICSHIYYEIASNPVASYKPGYRTVPQYIETPDSVPFDDGLASEQKEQVAARNLGNPVRGTYRITSKFGPRTPPATSFGQGSSFHRGIDIGARGRRDLGVIAVADGVVRGEYNSRKVPLEKNGRSGFKELTVTIDHGDGLASTYRHLDSVSVALGATVTKGQEIGIIGNTGNSGLPHLHYELKFKGAKIDPQPYLDNNAIYERRKQSSGEDIQSPIPTQATAEDAPPLLTAGETGVSRIEDNTLLRERLLTQILRPDVWFCAAPLCNVIFPSEYSGFTFTRQMMREISRLQIETYNSLTGGESDLMLQKFFWAPQFEGGTTNLDYGPLNAVRQKVVFDHEKFSGIIPKVEKLSQLSFFATLAETASSGAPIGDVNTSTGDTSGAREPGQETDIGVWANRIAHYNLLTQRYLARSASVNGRFMPRLVCGFPAIVLGTETSYDLTQATQTQQTSEFESQIARATRPIHFLGSIVSISHTLGAEGQAFTSVVLSKVRSHKTGVGSDDPLLDALRSDGSLSVQTANKSPTFDPETFEFSADSSTVVSGPVAEFIHALLFEFGLGSMFGTTSDAPFVRRVQSTLSIDPSREAEALSEFRTLRHPKFIRRAAGSGGDRNVETALEAIRQQILPQIQRFKGSRGKPIVDFKFTAPMPQDASGIERLFRSSITLDITASVGPTGQPAPIRNVTTLGQELTIRSYEQAEDLWNSDEYGSAPGNLKFFTVLGEEIRETKTAARQLYRVVPAFRGIVITESTYDNPDATKLPIEEAIRPAWISDDYSNKNIGGLYKKLIQCDSIISKVGKPAQGYIVPSVEQAVDILAAEYAEHPYGEDRARYVYEITKRGHADLLQVLGAKLEGDIDSGGFHSAAVGPYDNKEYLDLDSGLRGQNPETAQTKVLVSGTSDPRKERQERVLRYLSRISLTRGFRG